MLDEAPVLTIRKTIERAAPEAIDAFRGVPTSWVVDALGGLGALGHAIKPMAPHIEAMARFCGSALPCHCSPADNLALAAAVAQAQLGDVIVAFTDSYTGTSVTGDLVAGMARNRGVAAIVTDGAVRDVDALIDVGLPIFCSAVTPNSPARSGPGTVGLPITIGGMPVDAGDIVCGDRDGVVVVPRARIEEIRARLADVRAAEQAAEAKVQAGQQTPGYLADMLKSDRVRYVD